MKRSLPDTLITGRGLSVDISCDQFLLILKNFWKSLKNESTQYHTTKTHKLDKNKNSITSSNFVINVTNTVFSLSFPFNHWVTPQLHLAVFLLFHALQLQQFKVVWVISNRLMYWVDIDLLTTVYCSYSSGVRFINVSLISGDWGRQRMYNYFKRRKEISKSIKKK